jgi:hypothetical protein
MRSGLLALVVGVMCTPAQARADAYVNPWAGVLFGNDQAATGFRSIGLAVGNANHGLVGTETNIGLTPGFFGAGVENYVLDIMAGVTIGPTFLSKAKRDIRPFGILEGGTVRTSIDATANNIKLARNVLGLCVGGGATLEVTDFLAIRGDVRYFRTFDTADAGDLTNSLNVRLAKFHYWRAAIGVTLH